MPRVRRVTTPAPEPSPDSTVVICSGGDVLIKINDPTTGTEYCYRCSRNVLRGASEYFSVLLDPVKFSEGIAIEAALLDLKGQYYDTATIPASELPKAIVADVGDIPKSCVSTGIVVKLFFEILHDPSTTWPPVLRAQSVNLVALLAIVADRFACLKTIAEYLRRQGLETTLLKDRKSATAHQTELENRQKLFAGLLFGFQDWAYQCSVALIVEQRLDGSENEEHEGDDALWWNIPGGVEGAVPSCSLMGSADQLDRRACVSSRLHPTDPKLHTKTFHQSLHFQTASVQAWLQFIAPMRLVSTRGDDSLFLSQRNPTD